MIIRIICPKCHFSREVPHEKIPASARWATCPQCKERFELEQASLVSGIDSGPPVKDLESEVGRILSPWEGRAEHGLWAGISRTSKAVLFSPKSFFRRTAVEGGLKEPLAFGLLTGSAGMMLEVFWQFLLFGEIGETLFPLVETLLGSDATILLFLGIMALCPLLILITILITSTILHVLLSIVRGGKGGFEATFRVVSFSQAAQLWGLIPIVGSLIGALWLIAVQMIGLREIHESSYSRVAMALIIPLALLLLLLVMMVF
jgi:hypothetical protein